MELGAMQRSTKRRLVTALLLMVGVLVAGSFWLWYEMGEPLYRPGMVRAG